MNSNSTNSQTLARDTVPPLSLPPDKTLLDMLYYMKLTRELEFRIERKLYRQGKIVGGVYVGRGQEAIAVASCIDLRQDDVVCPSHRDMGAFLIRGMSLRTILAQYMARKTGATRGKDGNMHMGDLSKNLLPEAGDAGVIPASDAATKLFPRTSSATGSKSSRRT